MVWRNLPVTSTAALLILSGVIHGLWTDRWARSPDVADAVARLENIPSKIGEWQGTDLELDERELRVARIAGYRYRRYEHVRNRHSVVMLLVCGRPGPIAVHTPDVCFEGAGYKRVAAPVLFSLPGGTSGQDASFWTMRMRQGETPFAPGLRIFWSWSTGGPWQAPDNPRLSFAHSRILYKLYVLQDKAGEDMRPVDDPCAQFMKLLLPALDSALRGTL